MHTYQLKGEAKELVVTKDIHNIIPLIPRQAYLQTWNINLVLCNAKNEWNRVELKYRTMRETEKTAQLNT